MRITSLWRYPVKSMMGEELNACMVTEKGLVGDRAYGIVDLETEKLANAKNPKKWPTMFRYHAAFVEPVEESALIPPVRITLPNGEYMTSDAPDAAEQLTASFQRPVKLAV